VAKIEPASDDESGMPAWVRSLLEATREERSRRKPRKAREARTPRSAAVRSERVQVPRYRWSRAHAALVASGEPLEATATAAGVIVSTTAEGRRVLERLAE
jgi:hypothetical protein